MSTGIVPVEIACYMERLWRVAAKILCVVRIDVLEMSGPGPVDVGADAAPLRPLLDLHADRDSVILSRLPPR